MDLNKLREKAKSAAKDIEKKGLSSAKMLEQKSLGAVKTIGNKENVAAVKGLKQEFIDFLKEYKIIGLAIGFIMGAAASTIVKSMVDNIIMPLLTPFIPNGAWKEAILQIGPFAIKWGAFLGDMINFILLALAVFLIAKWILKEEKVAKK